MPSTANPKIPKLFIIYRESCMQVYSLNHGANMEVNMIVLYLSSFLCLYIFLILVKFINNVWWTPIRVRNLIASQGIKGPSNRFIHGSTKEIVNLRNKSFTSPMDVSDHYIFPRIHPHVYSWVKLYGMNFLNWHGPQAQLVVNEPELVKEILNNKDGTYPKVYAQGVVKKIVGDGLVTTQGKKWYKLRKLANHAFYADSLKGMIPVMILSVEMMLERWRCQDGKEIEVFQEFKILTSEVISRTAFGSNYLEGQSIFETLIKLAEIIARNEYKIRFPGIGKFLKSLDDLQSDKMEQEIRDDIIEIINKREKKVMDGEVDDYGNDFLGLLLKAYHDTDRNKSVSIDEMVDECKVFYIAGYETTTSSLAWTVLLLAINADWQEKARKEVLEIFGQQNPNSDGIARMKTMTMIINESLRLYPPVLSITRRVEREVGLGNLIIPANIEIYISTLALQSNEKIWGKDVHLFNSERFAEGIAKATNNNSAAFLPFGFGPRICVGMNFASTEIKMALSMILQLYKFTLSPNYIHSPVQLLTTSPLHGIQVILSPIVN